jgi:hypothetical protein
MAYRHEYRRERTREYEDEYLTFLLECMKENLNHARHVENERITFVSIQLVSVGMLMEMASKMELPAARLVLYGALLVLNFICSRLLTRWNSVFSAHSGIAKKIMRELEDYYAEAEDGVPPRGENDLYLFNNRLALFDAATPDKKALWRAAAEKKRRKRPYDGMRYVSTKVFFSVYNIVIYVLLGMVFLDSLLQLLGVPSFFVVIPS